MGRKTFISYKYSEATKLRDDIIKKLGEDAKFYKGETSQSPDLTDTTTENIRKKLKDMMYDTSVTIVIISPEMIKSKWIEWELKYCLKQISRKDRTSHVNGIVGVIQSYNGYDWFRIESQKSDGCTTISYQEKFLPEIIKINRYNEKQTEFACQYCKTYDSSTGSYISFVKECDFLCNPNKYIEEAYEKSFNDAECYDIKIEKI